MGGQPTKASCEIIAVGRDQHGDIRHVHDTVQLKAHHNLDWARHAGLPLRGIRLR